MRLDTLLYVVSKSKGELRADNNTTEDGMVLTEGPGGDPGAIIVFAVNSKGKCKMILASSEDDEQRMLRILLKVTRRLQNEL